MENNNNSSNSSIDENALIENFDYEPNPDDTSFYLLSLDTDSSVSLFTASDSGLPSSVTTLSKTEYSSITKTADSDSGISIFTV